MTSLREMKQREYIPNLTYLRMLIKGVVSFIYIFLTNFKDFKKITGISSKKRLYIRPKPRYEVPSYKKDMQYCSSNEKYLRPTLWCNTYSKEVIALANHLGAYKKSDKEFVDAAFDWVKRNITLEIVQMDSVEETLKRGTGTCIHINNVLVALCRCAGIKARYKLFAAITSQAAYNEMFDSMTRKWYDALGYFSIEGDMEAFINGKWMVAHAGPTPERQAAMNIPITTVGEEAIGIWFDAIPGTIFTSESIPYGIGLTLRLLIKIAPGTIDAVNANTLLMIEKGKKILEKKGGEKKYDEEIRKDFVPKFPKVSTEKHHNIIFK
jgi:ribosomal protein L17